MSLIARWRFEPGAFGVDSVGSNDLTTSGSPAVDTSWRMEGQSSGKFVRASDQFGYRTDANLSAGFPCRDGDVTPVKTFTFTGWFKLAVVNVTQGIFNKWAIAGSEANRCYNLHVLNTTLNFRLMDDELNEATKAHGTALAADTVYFFAAGYNQTNGYSCLRLRDINANVIGTDLDSEHRPAAWTGINDAAGAFNIGAHSANQNKLDGNLDDIRCYSGDYLTAAQTTQICRQSSGRAGKRLMMGG